MGNTLNMKGDCEVPTEDCLDNLIECVWHVLQTESQGQTGLFPCKRRCIDSLARLVGPDHYYTRSFQDLETNSDPMSLLAAVGVLTAAKEEMAKRKLDGSCSVVPTSGLNSTTRSDS
jgi:hypothetical protein